MDPITRDLAEHAADECCRAIYRVVGMGHSRQAKAQIALFALAAAAGAAAGILAAASGDSFSDEDRKRHAITVLQILTDMSTNGPDAALANVMTGAR